MTKRRTFRDAQGLPSTTTKPPKKPATAGAKSSGSSSPKKAATTSIPGSRSSSTGSKQPPKKNASRSRSGLTAATAKQGAGQAKGQSSRTTVPQKPSASPAKATQDALMSSSSTTSKSPAPQKIENAPGLGTTLTSQGSKGESSPTTLREPIAPSASALTMPQGSMDASTRPSPTDEAQSSNDQSTSGSSSQASDSSTSQTDMGSFDGGLVTAQQIRGIVGAGASSGEFISPVGMSAYVHKDAREIPDDYDYGNGRYEAQVGQRALTDEELWEQKYGFAPPPGADLSLPPIGGKVNLNLENATMDGQTQPREPLRQRKPLSGPVFLLILIFLAIVGYFAFKTYNGIQHQRELERQISSADASTMSGALQIADASCQLNGRMCEDRNYLQDRLAKGDFVQFR